MPRGGTPSLKDFDALSFDCYGTLIDWETGLLVVLRRWAEDHGVRASDEQLLNTFGEIESRIEAAHPRELYPDILARTMRDLGEHLGAPVNEVEARALATSVGDWPAFEDSADALARLAARYQLIVLSNVDRESFAESARRLGDVFTSVITAQDVGEYKPSPRSFEALDDERRRLGIADGRLLHVAQSLFHDHVPAQAARLATVWIDRRHDRSGWGATPAPSVSATPTWRFLSMEEFATACDVAAA